MAAHMSTGSLSLRACLAILLAHYASADLFDKSPIKLLEQQAALLLHSNTSQLAAEYGLRGEEYTVTTEDGYILTIHRIPGRGRPVLLMHPLMDSSESWLLRGEISLAVTLARLGLDVWMGNLRGNMYSKRHVNLDPKRDAKEYWNFSFHHHGYYDLPATIDLVLRTTGHSKLNAIGMSQGTTIFFVMGSARPEYNDKVNAFIAMAPVAFLHHLSRPLLSVIKATPILFPLLENLHSYEMLGDSKVGKAFQAVCLNPILGYLICALGILFPVMGADPNEYGPAFHTKASKRFPQSTSLMNLEHFVQLNQGRRFAWFDHGPSENLKMYGSVAPPDYDLGKMTMPVVLLCGKNDKLSLLADVAELRARLPSVVQYSVLERQRMNHVDFVWGKNMDQYLYPYVFSAMEKFF